MHRRLALVVIGIFLVPAGQAVIADESRPQVVFTDDEIEIIHGYYRKHDTPSKKAHKKHKGLPPGIAKNLKRGKPLPPGIAKRFLPEDLLVELPAAPDGYERIVVDEKIMLIEIATQVVQDVLADYLLGDSQASGDVRAGAQVLQLA